MSRIGRERQTDANTCRSMAAASARAIGGGPPQYFCSSAEVGQSERCGDRERPPHRGARAIALNGANAGKGVLTAR
jgi:hypothetical protein